MMPMVLMTTKEVSERLNTAPNTLRWWRHKGLGPRSFTLGPGTRGKVMYREEDVEAYLAERLAAADAALAAKTGSAA